MADNLEEALSEATTEETEESVSYLEIDSDLRTITIPSEITNIGVESDADVKRLWFRMPATYGEFDLSEFAIRINYLTANNDPDMYVVDDSEVVDDMIVFSWLIGRNACSTKGTVIFIVCLKLLDDDGVVVREFNTTLANSKVLEGLETSDAVIQEYSDIITSMLSALNSATETLNSVTKDAEQIIEDAEQVISDTEVAKNDAIVAANAANLSAANANAAATEANEAKIAAENAADDAEEAASAASEAAENAENAVGAITSNPNYSFVLNDNNTVSLVFDDGT